jgi:hypothetical protein
LTSKKIPPLAASSSTHIPTSIALPVLEEAPLLFANGCVGGVLMHLLLILSVSIDDAPLTAAPLFATIAYAPQFFKIQDHSSIQQRGRAGDVFSMSTLAKTMLALMYGSSWFLVKR